MIDAPPSRWDSLLETLGRIRLLRRGFCPTPPASNEGCPRESRRRWPASSSSSNVARMTSTPIATGTYRGCCTELSSTAVTASNQHQRRQPGPHVRPHTARSDRSLRGPSSPTTGRWLRIPSDSLNQLLESKQSGNWLSKYPTCRFRRPVAGLCASKCAWFQPNPCEVEAITRIIDAAEEASSTTRLLSSTVWQQMDRPLRRRTN